MHGQYVATPGTAHWPAQPEQAAKVSTQESWRMAWEGAMQQAAIANAASNILLVYRILLHWRKLPH